MPIYKPTKNHGWNVVLESKAENGKRKRKSYGIYATEKEAKKKLRELLSARDRGENVEPSEYTLGKVVELFFADPEKLELSGTTLHGYRQAWARAETKLGHIRLACSLIHPLGAAIRRRA